MSATSDHYMEPPMAEPTETKNLNYLLATTDAEVWAEAFVNLHGGDVGVMLAWFASAIETGRLAGREATDA